MDVVVRRKPRDYGCRSRNSTDACTRFDVTGGPSPTTWQPEIIAGVSERLSWIWATPIDLFLAPAIVALTAF